MKRRHRAKSDILIDLTSLLDVIFIILLVVIFRQQTLTEKQMNQAQSANAVMQEANALAEEAQAAYELYLDQMETADQLNQYVWAVSVYASYTADNVTERHIRILREGREMETFDLRGTNVQDALVEFQGALEKYVEEHSEQPVILSLNEKDEKILYRDEKAIRKIFEDLAERYENVFIK